MLIIDSFQARYFVDEVKDKSGKDINISSWTREFVNELPEQENGWVFPYFVPVGHLLSKTLNQFLL